MLTQNRIQKLYDTYLDIVQLEVTEFGCKPTEIRHLIGRLGELHAALHVKGKLSHVTNQHGFDVIARDGRKISVKTTAQKCGFVTINPNTLDKVDELMLIQYMDGKFDIVYYGALSKAVEVSRTWKEKYELDISKARKIT